MNSEHAAIARIANEYRARGYEVVIGPVASDVPFDLGSYRPDILAFTATEHVLIEVKTRQSSVPIETFKRVTDIVKQHSGWKFMLVTVPVDDADFTFQDTVAGVATVKDLLARLDSVIEGGGYVFALPYLWSAYVTCLRLKAMRAEVPFDSHSDRSLLNYLYSFGVLSHEEYESARHFLELRNSLVHGAIPEDISRGVLEDLRTRVDQLVTDIEGF